MKLGERIPIRDRFEKLCIPIPESGCWIWIGLCHPKYGYGRIRNEGSTKFLQAHRVSYELYIGSIPEGLLVCHRCDIRECVNPNHLFLGTITDNNRDMCAKKRDKNGKKYYCKNGHEFVLENIQLTSNGGRRCKICAKIYQKNYCKTYYRNKPIIHEEFL